jgi:hypothetical protein
MTKTLYTDATNVWHNYEKMAKLLPQKNSPGGKKISPHWLTRGHRFH